MKDTDMIQRNTLELLTNDEICEARPIDLILWIARHSFVTKDYDLALQACEVAAPYFHRKLAHKPCPVRPWESNEGDQADHRRDN